MGTNRNGGLQKTYNDGHSINNNSCHLTEHKLAAYKNWIHRLLRLPLNENKRKELNTIINIALNKRYKKDDIMNLHNKLKYQQNNQRNSIKMELKWVTFTYMGNYMPKITKFFKNSNLKVAFKTTTTISKLLGDTQRIYMSKVAYTKWPARAVIKYILGK
jgi:hypothetical protein